jgi:predicted component of type VI protein secretion system
MQGNESARLIVRRGPQPNQVYELNKDVVTLGRDITNDIVINDPEVSRHHMRLTRGAGSYTLEDLGSTNGTFVNGQRLTGAKPLNNGDMVGLGETVTLSYEMSRPQAEVTQRPADVAPMSPPPPQQPAAPVYNNPAYGAQPAYSQQSYSNVAPEPPPAYEYSPPAYPAYGNAAPPPADAGYDYDPYAVREEEPRSMGRWVLIGCSGLTLVCCCGSIVGAVIIDQACLWNRIPVVWQILQAVGYSLTC